MAHILNPFSYFNDNFEMDDIKIIYWPHTLDEMPRIHESSYDYYASISADVSNYIEKDWAAQCAKKPLENEPLVSVKGIHLEDGTLHVVPVDYKAWKTTGKKDFYQQYGKHDIPNPLNVQMLVETKDEHLILGPRPGKNVLQVPGGMLQGEADRTLGHIDIKKAAIREFHEEIAPLPVSQVSFLGTSFYAGRVLSTLYLMGQIGLNADEVASWRQEHKQDIKDFKDMPEICTIPATPERISDTLKNQKLQETAMIALLLFGRKYFGRHWLRRNINMKVVADHLQNGR